MAPVTMDTFCVKRLKDTDKRFEAALEILVEMIAKHHDVLFTKPMMEKELRELTTYANLFLNSGSLVFRIFCRLMHHQIHGHEQMLRDHDSEVWKHVQVLGIDFFVLWNSDRVSDKAQETMWGYMEVMWKIIKMEVSLKNPNAFLRPLEDMFVEKLVEHANTITIEMIMQFVDMFMPAIKMPIGEEVENTSGGMLPPSMNMSNLLKMKKMFNKVGTDNAYPDENDGPHVQELIESAKSLEDNKSAAKSTTTTRFTK